jgi:pimeloyl-ACP methyl ester carboxylesterase
MFINEYGNPNDPKLILLAPMMISGSDLYSLMSPYLKGEYFIIAPDQGGHGKAGEYISADDEYRQLRAYLQKNGYTDIKLVYGASLGVAVGWRLFMDEGLTIEHAWFDGVALSEKPSRMAEILISRLFKKRKKKLERTHVEASQSLVKWYGYDFAKRMTKNFERITLNDIDAICYACCHYDMKVLTPEQQRKLHLEYGEKDFDLKLSGKSFPKYMPEVKPVIRKGYPHCGYMAAHTKEYTEEIETFISNV